MKRILAYFKKTHAYYLCGIITVCVVVLSAFCFPNSIGRLIESCRDFGLSFVYYISELLELELVVTPTVCDLPDYDFLSLETVFSFIENFRHRA